jgi:hypothetical protein
MMSIPVFKKKLNPVVRNPLRSDPLVDRCNASRMVLDGLAKLVGHLSTPPLMLIFEMMCSLSDECLSIPSYSYSSE